MDTFLDAFKQPKLNQENIIQWNKSVKSNEIEAVIKSLPIKKNPGPDGFTAKFYQISKEELILMLLKLFQGVEREEHYQTHSMKLVLLSIQIQTRAQWKKKRIKNNIFNDNSCKISQ
jgi:hypothetical protein